jgi:CxxC motif-containing protein
MCPLGCSLEVEKDAVSSDITVCGNGCKKGAEYGRQELVEPKRTVTTLCKLKGGGAVSVKTSRSVAKEKIFEVVSEIKKITVKSPVKIGGVIIENVCGTGADIIATKNILNKNGGF